MGIWNERYHKTACAALFCAGGFAIGCVLMETQAIYVFKCIVLRMVYPGRAEKAAYRLSLFLPALPVKCSYSYPSEQVKGFSFVACCIQSTLYHAFLLIILLVNF